MLVVEEEEEEEEEEDEAEEAGEEEGGEAWCSSFSFRRPSSQRMKATGFRMTCVRGGREGGREGRIRLGGWERRREGGRLFWYWYWKYRCHQRRGRGGGREGGREEGKDNLLTREMGASKYIREMYSG